MKLVLVSALMVAVASAALVPLRQYTRPQIYPSPSPSYSPLPPQTYNQPTGRVYAIVRSDSDIAPDGSSYQYAYDTENGISAQESGSQVGSGTDAGTAAVGSYSFTSPEGVLVQVGYVADQNGFQPTGNVLPTSPPVPLAIQRSLEYNAAHPEPQSPENPSPVRKYY